MIQPKIMLYSGSARHWSLRYNNAVLEKDNGISEKDNATSEKDDAFSETDHTVFVSLNQLDILQKITVD